MTNLHCRKALRMLENEKNRSGSALETGEVSSR